MRERSATMPSLDVLGSLSESFCSPEVGRKNGAFSGAFGGSLGLLRSWPRSEADY